VTYIQIQEANIQKLLASENQIIVPIWIIKIKLTSKDLKRKCLDP